MRYLVWGAILAFVAWRLYVHVKRRVLIARGMAPPEPPPGVRPITKVAIALLVVYGAYVIWHVATS